MADLFHIFLGTLLYLASREDFLSRYPWEAEGPGHGSVSISTQGSSERCLCASSPVTQLDAFFYRFFLSDHFVLF